MTKTFTVPQYIQSLVDASSDGLSGISNKLSDLLKVPVIITDSIYQVLSCSMGEGFENEVHIDFEYTFEPTQNCSFFDCIWMIKDVPKEGFGHSIKLDNTTRGYLFILLEHSKLQHLEEKHSLINFVSDLCSFHIQKRIEIRQERRKFKEAFLYNVLYGNYKTKSDIISYGAIWHWNLDQPHIAIVFSIVDFDYYSADRLLIDNVLRIVETSLMQQGIDPIILKKQREVIALLPINDQTNFSNKEILSGFILDILNKIKNTNSKERIACGAGKIYDNPADLFRSYQEAKIAMEIGLLLEKKIPYFIDLGLERILYKHDLQDLKEFYFSILGNLIKFDTGNEGELLLTLEKFAENQFDLKKTSEELFLHRNTLRYRIKKIEEILDTKLNDFDTRLNIMAALKIKQLHQL